MILIGIGGTVYLAIRGVYADEYEVPAYSLAEFERLLSDSTQITIVDVRNRDEITDLDYLRQTVVHIPLYLLEKRSVELVGVDNYPVVVVCPNGKRSRQGAQILRMAGYNAYYLENGLLGF
jgi:rhodanese-related sulfurtransferase